MEQTEEKDFLPAAGVRPLFCLFMAPLTGTGETGKYKGIVRHTPTQFHAKSESRKLTPHMLAAASRKLTQREL